MTKFGILDSDGNYEETADIPQSQFHNCPFLIMLPEHYRADGTCRCDDPDHIEMIEWEYVWDVKTERWIASPDDDE